MKIRILLLVLCFFALALQAQKTITTTEWQADLRFLQHTVHKDYPFLFKKITAEQFDQQVDQLYAAIPSLQPHEIIVGLKRIVALFGYGHTSLSLDQDHVPFHVVPLNLYWFEEGIFVEGVQNDYKDILGAKIIAVEGVPVAKALQSLRPVLSTENDQFFRAYVLDYLLMPEILHAQKITSTLKNSVQLTLQIAGKEVTKDLAAVPSFRMPRSYGFTTTKDDWTTVRDPSKTPLYLKNLDKIYHFEYLPEQKTVYVRQSQIQDDPSESIPVFYERVFNFIENNEVERFILDVRLNGGGNNYKNKPIVTGVIACEKINRKGKFFVLLGRRTFSACQNLVNELDNYTNAIFIGEPTSENINFYGDNRKLELPNSKLSAYLSFAWWQDKPQWENADWLAPNVAIASTFDAYHNNQDPVLEAALSTSGNEELILDPIGHLRDLFMERKIEEVVRDAKMLAADPKYRYYQLEDQLNKTGYQLMDGGQMEPALFVFQLIADLYPESANAWDSLGEAHWKAGQKDQAIEFYSKALALDPEGWVGDNARQMLEKIKKE